jgi:hypothetical protein
MSPPDRKRSLSQFVSRKQSRKTHPIEENISPTSSPSICTPAISGLGHASTSRLSKGHLPVIRFLDYSAHWSQVSEQDHQLAFSRLRFQNLLDTSFIQMFAGPSTKLKGKAEYVITFNVDFIHFC